MQEIESLVAESGLEYRRLPDNDPHPIRKDGVVLIIEEMKLGRGYCAQQSMGGLKATWLETKGGQVVGEKPDWALPAYNLSVRPDCLGFYEPGDHICDGGLNPETKEEEPPCAWRDRCKRIKRLASSDDPDDVYKMRMKMSDGDLARSVRPAKKDLPPEEEIDSRAAGREVFDLLCSSIREIGGFNYVPRAHRASEGSIYTVEKPINNTINILLKQFRNGKHRTLARGYCGKTGIRLELNTNDEMYVITMVPDDVQTKQADIRGNPIIVCQYLRRDNAEDFARCIVGMIDSHRFVASRLFQ